MADREPEIPQRAKDLATSVIGTRHVQALGHHGLSIGWRHHWRGLWRWYEDAREVFAEILIDERCPDELRQRAQAMLGREI